jgi:hypothetical protein
MKLMATFFRMQLMLTVCLPSLPIIKISLFCFSRRRWCSIRR